MYKALLKAYILLFCVVHTHAQTLRIEISGIKNLRGQICVGVFDSQAGFKTEKPYWEGYYKKHDKVKNGKLHLIITLEPGIYGITVLDDENEDGKMRFNILGIPLEGFGFGNFKLRGIRRPHFNDFSIELKKSETKDISVIMNYF